MEVFTLEQMIFCSHSAATCLLALTKSISPDTEIADNNKQADKVMQQGGILIIFVLEKTGQSEVPHRNNLLTDTWLQQIDIISGKKITVCYSCHSLLSITATDVLSMLFLC